MKGSRYVSKVKSAVREMIGYGATPEFVVALVTRTTGLPAAWVWDVIRSCRH